MADIAIEIGKTDGFRYVGFQPPLTIEQRAQLGVIALPGWMFRSSSQLQQPAKGEAYTEIGFITDALPSPVAADQAITEVAQNFAHVLRSNHLEVTVDPELKVIGYGYYLFGGEAERLG